MPYAKVISVKQMETKYSFQPETYFYIILYCFCTEKATDSDFINVIQLLGPDDLKKLFYALDIKQRNIHVAERCSTSPEIEDFKAIQVFQKWKKDCGKKATRKLILDALRRCDNIMSKLKRNCQIDGRT